MKRAGILIALLFAMLCQSLALARAAMPVEAAGDPAHAALHWEDQAHHHHDDASYHVDDSDESVQHLAADHVTAPVGLLLNAVSPSLPAPGASLPGPWSVRFAPQPFLDGPLKPPR